MIIVTGAAGFIGSHCALHFSQKKITTLVAVDDTSAFSERGYLQSLKGLQIEDRHKFLENLNNFKSAKLVIHMGAITNTAASDLSELNKWNVDYSRALWNFCAQNQIPFIYASSAATYGNGQKGFKDEHRLIPTLEPLNMYGQSKQTFDQWAIVQRATPPLWYGLKFFNVYGPHENHKARMASSIWHGYNEILNSGAMTLFKSHNPNFKDGHQSRDFIYIADTLKIMDFLLKAQPTHGIYNCGTGKAGTFLELSRALFKKMGKVEKISWIDTPMEFRKSYQYKTEADTIKLLKAGYKEGFTDLEAGVEKYLNSF